MYSMGMIFKDCFRRILEPCLRSNNNWTPVNPDGSLPRRFSERSLAMAPTGPRNDSVVEMKVIHHN